MSTKVMKQNAKQLNKKEDPKLTEEEQEIVIKKRELLDYAEKMTNAKEMHKNRSKEFKEEIYELRDQTEIYASEYRKLKNLYKDTQKELNDLQERINNKRVHKVKDVGDVVIGNIEEEIKQIDEEAKNNYAEKRKKKMADFMKQFDL
jgi:hypothetical protein